MHFSFPSLASALFTLCHIAHAAPTAISNQALLEPKGISTHDPEKRAIPAWTYYIDADSATHQSKFDTLSSQGYRIISLSTYGSSTSAQYAAVWVQRSGPAYVAVHNANGTVYQQWFDKYTAQGYVPTLITATGPQDSAIYAGVMEKITVSSYLQKCGLTGTDLETNIVQAFQARQIIKSFREYGTSLDRRYCALWHANPNYDKYDWWQSTTAADYQTVFDAEITKPYSRPTYLSISEDQKYTSLFTDTSVGPWVARHGLTSAQLQSEVQTQMAAGRYMIHLTAGGASPDTRYAALFASQDTPSPRTWRVNGDLPTGFKDNSNASSSAETALKSFMQAAGARQAQLSVAKNGVSLLDKAYTWSEPERVTTHVNSPFLLASVSKAFVEAAIQSLFDNGKLTADTKVYSLLGYNSTTGDQRRFQITVQHLLDHYGGYNTTASGDPTYNMRNIALVQSNGSRPASTKDVVDYMFPQDLDFIPGTAYSYSNYGYLLLSYVVEFVTKQPYYTYLQSTILIPENLLVKPYLTDPSTHTHDPVVQESVLIGPTALHPLSPLNVAAIYGGDGMYKDSCLGPAALAANAQSLTKFINKHAVWGNGGRAAGYARTGSTPGARSWAQSRADGVDWALTVNTRDFPGGEDDFENVVVAAVTAWLDTNPTL